MYYQYDWRKKKIWISMPITNHIMCLSFCIKGRLTTLYSNINWLAKVCIIQGSTEISVILVRHRCYGNEKNRGNSWQYNMCFYFFFHTYFRCSTRNAESIVNTIVAIRNKMLTILLPSATEKSCKLLWRAAPPPLSLMVFSTTGSWGRA